jgi:hypothetical protein
VTIATVGCQRSISDSERAWPSIGLFQSDWKFMIWTRNATSSPTSVPTVLLQDETIASGIPFLVVDLAVVIRRTGEPSKLGKN